MEVPTNFVRGALMAHVQPDMYANLLIVLVQNVITIQTIVRHVFQDIIYEVVHALKTVNQMSTILQLTIHVQTARLVARNVIITSL